MVNRRMPHMLPIHCIHSKKNQKKKMHNIATFEEKESCQRIKQKKAYPVQPQLPLQP